MSNNVRLLWGKNYLLWHFVYDKEHKNTQRYMQEANNNMGFSIKVKKQKGKQSIISYGDTEF